MGEFQWSDKNYYKGSYYKGKKHGHGELVMGNVVHRGEFENGKRNGEFEVYDLKGGKEVFRCRERY
jgi:hypothetical protein